MRIFLKQLNASHGSLEKIAQAEFSKEHHKIKYKLSRIWKSAEGEREEMQSAIRDLLRKCGIVPGQQIRDLDPKVYADFQDQEREFLKSVQVELWGDPFDCEGSAIIEETARLTAMDLANLDWLLTTGEPDEKA